MNDCKPKRWAAYLLHINWHIDACNPCRRTSSWFAASARSMPHMLNFHLLELMTLCLCGYTRVLNF
ncbi:hypothetical protein GGI35DRAFT_446512 [Trichoderma velutinum]